MAESNVDPLTHIRFEELARVAELHVADATGLPTSVAGRQLSVRPVTRAEWAAAALEAYRPLLERLAAGLAAGDDDDADDDPADPTMAFLGNISQVMSPVLVGMQSGFMTGTSPRALVRTPSDPRPPAEI